MDGGYICTHLLNSDTPLSKNKIIDWICAVGFDTFKLYNDKRQTKSLQYWKIIIEKHYP